MKVDILFSAGLPLNICQFRLCFFSYFAAQKFIFRLNVWGIPKSSLPPAEGRFGYRVRVLGSSQFTGSGDHPLQIDQGIPPFNFTLILKTKVVCQTLE